MPVPVVKTPTGRYLVPTEGERAGGAVVLYARVCSADQKADLDRQVVRLAEWATGNRMPVSKVVSEVGSALEKEWRAAHPERYPWFGEDRLSSRVPKEACRVRATGFSNYLKSKKSERRGAKMGFPKWRKRKHGSRFHYDADRAKPLDSRTVRLPAIGDVAIREDMSWLTSRSSSSASRR